jgi:hypothetical protein
MHDQAKLRKQSEKSNLSQALHSLFASMLSTTPHPEVAKDYLRDKLNRFARVGISSGDENSKLRAPKALKCSQPCCSNS